MRRIISGPTRPIFTKFSPYGRYLIDGSGDVATETNFGVKLPSFVTLTFQNELQDRNSDLRILNANDLCILCTNFVTFAPINPEIMRAEIATFAMTTKNWYLGPNIS